MKYDAIIIGSGLGGLVSCALLAKEGKKVLLLEQHSRPGGYCVSYNRSGFIFDVPSIMNQLQDDLYLTLKSLGFYEEIEWVRIEKFAKIIYPVLEVVMPAENLEGCRENLKKAFPSEKKAVDAIFLEIDKFRSCAAAIQREGKRMKDTALLLLALPQLIRLSRISFYDYLKKFTDNERLISVLSNLSGFAGLPSKKACAINLVLLSYFCYGAPVLFPKYGFQSVADFLAKKAVRFGAEIKYGANVCGVLIENKKAIGVKTQDSKEYYADVVISNADTKKTFLELAGKENLSSKFAAGIEAYQQSASGVSLCVGTSLDLSKLDLKYGQVFYNEGWEDDNIIYDKTLANSIDFERDKIQIGIQATSLLSAEVTPKDTHLLHLIFAIGNGYFKGYGREEYLHRKDALAGTIIKKIEKVIPQLSGSVVVKDLATPYTFERYTLATAGAWYDGVPLVARSGYSPSVKTPIENLYLAGTKVFGAGGMPVALMGGIKTARAVLGDKGCKI